MDLIFQTLTSLYTRSNSPVVIRSDFSHTSFLPGFQKMGAWGGGDLGWAALPSLSFSGCFKLGLTTVLPSSGITLMENGTKHKEPQALESPFFHLCTCFTIILSLIVKKKKKQLCTLKLALVRSIIFCVHSCSRKQVESSQKC